MIGEFSIRRCDAGDAPTLASLGAKLFSDSYGPTHPEPELSRYLARSFSVASVRDAMSSDDVSMLLVEDSVGHPIAYAYLRPSPEPPNGVNGSRPFEIVRFYVDTARQGKGVGAALMEACFSDAKKRGADVLWLQVWTQAPWAIGFYQRLGFSVVGSTTFCFGERIDDDHVMSRSL
ncbi:MAG TPA: GNAT family N-acetyltransferase [Gemmatimonadaceae bacterium]|nr:GNAT family N-acetyltransferase [Gemmatimonadaceae bacterium]